MKVLKTDNRSKYTQMVVKNNLLKLLQEKPINKITVNELCKIADINRGTFYHHFYDVYDVYEQIQNELFEEIKVKLELVKTFDLDKSFFKEILLLIYKHYDICRLIMEKGTKDSFLSSSIEFIKEKFLNEWSKTINGEGRTNLEYIFTYATNGAIGIIASWVNGGMVEPLDDIAELIASTNKVILESAKNLGRNK